MAGLKNEAKERGICRVFAAAITQSQPRLWVMYDDMLYSTSKNKKVPAKVKTK
jgi:hypothetical protein